MNEYVIAINTFIGVANMVALYRLYKLASRDQVTRIEHPQGSSWVDKDGYIINSTTKKEQLS